MLLLCLFVVCLSAATTPVHPQWPRDFSTTAIFHESGRRRPEFTRWFYSAQQNTDRLGEASMFFPLFSSHRVDGLTEWEGELYYAERFFNHNTQREYNVFYQRDSSVQCFSRPLQNPLPKPNFLNFTFVGEVGRALLMLSCVVC